MRRLILLLVLCVALPACSSAGSPPVSSGTGVASGGNSAATPVGADVSASRTSPPISSQLGVRWPGADLPAGTVLFDNGSRLVAYSLDGTNRVIWSHRRVMVPAIAASLNGREVAYIVGGGLHDQMLDLRPDGSITVVGSGSMWEPPAFLRTPAQPSAPARIHYTTQSPSGHGAALWMQTPRGAEKVTVNLRGGEWPLMVTGYPGSFRAALTLIRNDQPPVVEFVLDQDRWSTFLSMGGSDGLYTPAWLSPTRLLVGGDAQTGRVDVTLWPACYGYPGRRVGSYPPVRDPSDGAPNPDMLALDSGHALIISAAHPHSWSLFTVRTGRVTATAIPYRLGGWAVVRGPTHPRC